MAAKKKDSRKDSKDTKAESVVYIPATGGQSDILRPALICYGDRCYRKLTGDTGWSSARGSGTGAATMEQDPYEDVPGCCAEDVDQELRDIVELQSGEYQVEMDLPSVFYKYIIGRAGRTKTQLEKDTKCSIKIPHRGEAGPVVIKGLTMRSVSAAKQRIEVLAWSNRECEEITHFICLPLNHSAIMESVSEFKRSVLAIQPRPEGVSDEMFTDPSRMHLTLVVFRLFTESEVSETLRVVEECVKEARSCFTEPGNISISGLDTMSDDHTSASVLYGRVSEGASDLQRFADDLLQRLMKALPDYVDRRHRVKLHATLINASKKKGEEGGERQGRDRYQRRKVTFDASPIMKNLASHKFGSVPLKEVHFSQRGEYDCNGFYKCISTIPLFDDS